MADLVPHARIDRYQSVSYGIFGVIMRVNTQIFSRYSRFNNLHHYFINFTGQRAAICITKNKPARAGPQGHF